MNSSISNKLIFSLIISGTLLYSDVLLAQHKNDVAKVDAIYADTLLNPIPTQRSLFTTNVYRLIEAIDKRDGIVDNKVKFKEEKSTEIISKALIDDSKALVVMIENMSTDHTNKIKYHKITEKYLRKMNTMSWTEMRASQFKEYASTIRQMIIADYNGTLPSYAEQNASLITLELSEYFDNDNARGILFNALAEKYPEKLIPHLNAIANKPYADPVVAAAAKKMPGIILSYAQSTSKLSGLVRRNNDPLVKTIVQIADNSTNTLKVLPFLGAINRGEKSIKEIDNIANADDKYLQALVDLVVANEQLGREAIDQEIKIRSLKYVYKINELHNSPNNVRFASIQQFRDIDYYIMIVAGQDDIYTSSFTNGPFALMMNKLEGKSGMQLLEKLNHYHFRTFIRLTAGFNRLSQFLKSMPENEKTALLQKFVTNLEAGDIDELEDAVDVADAYGSIKDPELITFLKNEINTNYNRCKNIKSTKGVIVYGLLSTIFDEKGTGENVAELGIPPISYVPHNQLLNEKNEIIEQMFFYGDDDGKTAFAGFLNLMKADKNWKFEDSKYWVTFTSTSNNKVVVYANKPLTEPEDEVAQRALKEHMSKHDIIPTVVVHRGHSYFVNTTLEHITPDVKVVLLGSCGGYHNLAGVLNRSTDAHIISSKQTGTRVVNEIIIKDLHNILLSGNDLNWINMWQGLENKFSKMSAYDRDYFNDYVPPNKNLGAIFIKAYRNIQENI